MRQLFGLAVASALTGSATVYANPVCEPVQAKAQIRKIVRLREAAVQVERDGRDHAQIANEYDFLCPGDGVVVLEETARAWLRMAGRDRAEILTARERRREIPRQSRLGPIGWVQRQLGRVASLFMGQSRGPNSSVPTHGGTIIGGLDFREWSRAVRNYSEVEEGKLARHPLLTSEIQFLPRDANYVSLLWGGEAIALEIRESNRGYWIEPLLGTEATISFPPSVWISGGISVDVSASEDNLRYQIYRSLADTAPSPPELQGRTDLSEQERLGRAVWLLNEPDLEEWHLFAMSELRQLSSEFVVAGLILQALSGETDEGEFEDSDAELPNLEEE
jgi:hypothetical protein